MTAGLAYIIRRPDGTDIPARFGTATAAERARTGLHGDGHTVVAVFGGDR